MNVSPQPCTVWLLRILRDPHPRGELRAVGERDPQVLDFLHLRFGGSDDIALLSGYQHVVGADRNTRAGRQTIAVLHQFVGKDDRLLESATPEGGIDVGFDDDADEDEDGKLEAPPSSPRGVKK